MKRLLRIEVAIAILLFAPLIGYAIGFLVSNDAAPIDAARATTGALPAMATADSAVRRVFAAHPVGRAGA